MKKFFFPSLSGMPLDSPPRVNSGHVLSFVTFRDFIKAFAPQVPWQSGISVDKMSIDEGVGLCVRSVIYRDHNSSVLFVGSYKLILCLAPLLIFLSVTDLIMQLSPCFRSQDLDLCTV